MEERRQPAPTKEVGEGSPAAPELVVFDLDFGNKTPAPMEPVEVGELRVEGGHPAPPEPKAEEVAPVAGEGEAAATANEGEAGLADEDSPSPPARVATQRAARKASSQPPRPPSRFSAMEDALQAERLLERVHLPCFRVQLHRETASRLLNVTYVSVLQMANEVLAIRDSMIRTCNSVARSQERVDKYRDRCKGMAEKFTQKLEEAKAHENELASKLLALEVDRNEWRARFSEAESKATIEFNRTLMAEAKLVVVSRSLASTEGRVDELTRWLKDAESWADIAATNAHAVEERATAMEAAAQEAEQKRVEAVA